MLEKIIFAGFGGQGIVLMGKAVAYAGMKEGRHVTHFPAYGVAMRGGTATCTVVVSDDEIASPVVPAPDTVIAMNQPSADKYFPMIRPGGRMYINSDLVESRKYRDDIQVIPIPANAIAEACGTIKIANMAMLGAYAGNSGVVTTETLKKMVPEMVSKRRQELVKANLEAIDQGAAAGKK